MGVGVRIAAQPRQALRVLPQLLVVGERVQPVRVEIVEGGAAVVVPAALGRDEHPGQAAVLRAVGIGEYLELRDRVQAGRRVPHRTEDGVGRGLSVLDVAHAVAAATQELDVVEAAEHVRVQQQEGLDVPAAPGQVVELLLVEPAGDGAAVERDVVKGFRGHHDRFGPTAQLELGIDARGTRRPQEEPRPLVFLEVGGGDLDAVGAGLEVGGFEAPLSIRPHGARHARALVDDEHGGILDRGALRIDDRAADRAEERLSVDSAGGPHDAQEQYQEDPSHVLLLARSQMLDARRMGNRKKTTGSAAFYTFCLTAVNLFYTLGPSSRHAAPPSARSPGRADDGRLPRATAARGRSGANAAKPPPRHDRYAARRPPRLLRLLAADLAQSRRPGLRRHPVRERGDVGDATIDAETRERLQTLGYTD